MNSTSQTDLTKAEHLDSHTAMLRDNGVVASCRDYIVAVTSINLWKTVTQTHMETMTGPMGSGHMVAMVIGQ